MELFVLRRQLKFSSYRCAFECLSSGSHDEAADEAF